MRRSENYKKHASVDAATWTSMTNHTSIFATNHQEYINILQQKTNTRIYGNTINKLCALFLHRMHTLVLSARVVKETRCAGIFWLCAGISFLGARSKNDSLRRYLLTLRRNPPPPVLSKINKINDILIKSIK